MFGPNSIPFLSIEIKDCMVLFGFAGDILLQAGEFGQPRLR
jgi:hypothetical protein